MNVAPSRLSRTPAARPAAWNRPTSSSAQRCIQTMPWKKVNAVSHRDFPGSTPRAPTLPLRNVHQTAHAYHAPRPHARSAGSPSDNGRSAPTVPIANTGATTQTSSRCPRDIRGADSPPARRGIVEDMASRTGAAATAPRPTPSVSSASPLSTLAHSAIASARAMNEEEEEEEDTAGDAVDRPGDDAEFGNRPVGSSFASSSSTSTSTSASSSPPPTPRRTRGAPPTLLISTSPPPAPFSAPSRSPPSASSATSSSPSVRRAGECATPPARRTSLGSTARRPHPKHTTHAYRTYESTSADDSSHETVSELMAINARMSIARYADTSRRYGNGSTATPCCE
mmetsp:Transcript_12245/g.51489  ORF Transcript_12245/g.51489 Transcript_12245/m.51489 type:complete len:340 (+) Transcript_12245:2035-3054(+)